jgi:hypothetical protein
LAAVVNDCGQMPHVDDVLAHQPLALLGIGAVELEGTLLRASRSRSSWLRGAHCSPTIR